MEQKRAKYLIFILSTLVMLPYTNCSNTNVSFDSQGNPVLGDGVYDSLPDTPPGSNVQLPDETVVALEPAPESAPQPAPAPEPAPVPHIETPPEEPAESTEMSSMEEELALNQMPIDESVPPTPVTELQNDPGLFETYSCDGGNGVVICHLPSDVSNMHSLCVGKSAAKTHYDHVRTVSVDGATSTMTDYLGPCRR